MPRGSQTYRPVIVIATCVLVFWCLYAAQAVFIPIAMAILITFLLSPIVDVLQRWHLGRVAPVIIVVALLFVLVGGLGWLLVVQAKSVAEELPRFKNHILEKIAEVRIKGRGPFSDRVQESLREITSEIEKETPEERAAKPVPVKVQQSHWSAFTEPLASAGLVIVLVIFMLLARRELRDRLIRLIGHHQLTITTKAMDEAGARISRYLLMQCLVNGIYGLAVGVGLFLIGVEYSLLWGFLAAILRFIPYAGPFLAAALPVALSLASSPGWSTPIMTVGLFVVLELATNMIMEPLVYGRSAGTSQVALLIAIAFWTWLWGPIGLLLATPLTVCIVVMGKYVPQLGFITILLGDEPITPPDVGYYQRLLAKDEDEAMQIVDEQLKSGVPELVYDEVVLPTLSYIRRDLSLDQLTQDEVDFLLRATKEIVNVLTLRQVKQQAKASEDGSATAEPALTADLPTTVVLCCPASGEGDEIALHMLQQLMLPGGRCSLEILGHELLLSEVLALVEERKPGVVCIGSCRPGGLTQTRHLVKRLRSQFADLRIVAGRWGPPIDAPEEEEILSAGADRVSTTLLATRKEILELAQLAPVSV